jgi:anti-sigma B factor antagonist
MAELPASEIPQTLTVTTTRRSGAVVVSLAGDLDMTTVGQAAAALRAATDQGVPVVLDMTEVRFFSSAGLNLLLQLHEDVRDRQLDVRVAGDQRAVIRPLELTGLTELFPIHPSLSDALAATPS